MTWWSLTNDCSPRTPRQLTSPPWCHIYQINLRSTATETLADLRWSFSSGKLLLNLETSSISSATAFVGRRPEVITRNHDSQNLRIAAVFQVGRFYLLLQTSIKVDSSYLGQFIKKQCELLSNTPKVTNCDSNFFHWSPSCVWKVSRRFSSKPENFTDSRLISSQI